MRCEWDERKNRANQRKPILLVAHTYHDSEGEEQEEVIRIISARQATAAERRAYYGETEPRH